MDKQPLKPVFYDTHKKRWPRVKYGTLTIFGLLFVTFAAFILSLLMDARLEKNPNIPAQYSLNNIQTETANCTETFDLNSDNNFLALVSTTPMDASCLIEQGLRINTFQKMAFLSYPDITSLNSLRHHLSDLDVVFIQGAHLKSANADIIEDEPETINRLPKEIHRRNTLGKAILVLDNPWSNLTPEFLAHSESRQKAIQYEVNYLTKNQFDGLNIHFEYVPAEAFDNMNQFMQELSAALHAQNLSLFITASVQDSIQNLKRLTKNVDHTIALLNNEHSAENNAGPLASLAWVQKNLKNLANEIPGDKLVIGLGNYGLDWKEHQNNAQMLSFSQAMALATSANAQITLDPISGNPHFSYKENNNTLHTVWFLDAVTLFNQLKLTESIHPAGIALWQVGTEDPSLWSIYNETGTSRNSALKLSRINPSKSLTESGKPGGEIFVINQMPQIGEREIAFDDESGFIVNEQYTKLPLTYNIQSFGVNDKKKIALTFDDGPSAKYTPQILGILRDTHTPASFFVLGRNVLKNPDLVKQEIAEGHDIGNHTYSHPNIAEISNTKLAMELTSTKRLLESTTGRSTLLFRAPHGIDSTPTTLAEVKRNAEITQLGYYTVGMSIDPRDWERPGTDKIVQSVLNQVHQGNGNVILLHDGGNNRQQTVNALPHIIAQLRQEGYQFTSISEILNIDRNVLMPAHTPMWYHWISRFTFEILQISSYFIPLIYFIGIVIVTVRLFGLTTLSLYQKWKTRHSVAVDANHELFSLAVIVPAYNEAANIVRTIESLLAAKKPKRFEIIVVNDGSTDNTLDVLNQHFSNNPLIKILNQTNSGKGAALNYGLSQTNADFVTIIDADTLITPDTLLHLMRPLHNPKVGAVAGNIRIANPTNLMTKWQILEYATGQSLDRRALSAIDAVVVVPGALGCWRRAALLEAGLFTPDTLAEDADMTVQIKRLGYQVAVAEEADGYTEVPETIREFLRQRFRWMYGTYQVVWKHIDAFFKPQYGKLGFIALPNLFLIHVILPLIAPLTDLIFILLLLAISLKAAFGYTLTPDNILQLKTIGFYYVIFTGIDLLTTFLAFFLEGKEKKSYLIWLIPQRFFYKQLIYFVAFRSVLAALHGREVWWGRMTRKQPAGA